MIGDSVSKRRCQAMAEVGIEDPESQKGIDFCTQKCPYEKCIVFEYDRRITYSRVRRETRVATAKKMEANEYSVEDIAKELKVNTRTVRRYLKR